MAKLKLNISVAYKYLFIYTPRFCNKSEKIVSFSVLAGKGTNREEKKYRKESITPCHLTPAPAAAAVLFSTCHVSENNFSLSPLNFSESIETISSPESSPLISS